MAVELTDDQKAQLAAALAARTGGVTDQGSPIPTDTGAGPTLGQSLMAKLKGPAPTNAQQLNYGVGSIQGLPPGSPDTTAAATTPGSPDYKGPAPVDVTAPSSDQLSLGQPTLSTGGGGGSQATKLVNDLTLGGTGETQPTKPAAPVPIVNKQPVAKTPAQTDGMPPELRPEAIGEHLIGIQERLNNVKLAKDQNARGPQDIYAQQANQVLDKQADFYSHSLDQIRAHQDNLDQLTQQLQGATGFYQGGERSRLEQAINSERNIVSDLVRNSSGNDPTTATYRANKLANISDLATAALTGAQRDDADRAENDKILTGIQSATAKAWQDAKADNDKSTLSAAMTGKTKAEGGLAGAQAGLARAQTEQTKATTGYTQQGMAALGLLNRLPANGMTPELENAIGTYHPDLRVPGAGGIAQTPENAKEATKYLAETDPILGDLQTMINFRAQHGATVPFTKSNEEAKTMGANFRLKVMGDNEMKRSNPELWKTFENLTPLDIGTISPHAMDAMQTYQSIKAGERAAKLDALGVKYWKRPTIFKPGLRG